MVREIVITFKIKTNADDPAVDELVYDMAAQIETLTDNYGFMVKEVETETKQRE
jgi:hypothetical protein